MPVLDNTSDQQTLKHTRPLTPTCEEAEANSSDDDSKSVSSLPLFPSIKPRLRLRNFTLHRRSEPQLSCNNLSRSNNSGSSANPSPNVANLFQRKMYSNLRTKPLPPIPAQAISSPIQIQELSCHRCYYFAAKNCKGWTMGGSSDDACETCLQAGFFGAP